MKEAMPRFKFDYHVILAIFHRFVFKVTKKYIIDL